MELVYLWVENYKNIKKQGFNFSPRFECKYDKYSKELIIVENENYVNIFPDNINITAIVGENGSGKSSIFYSLIDYIAYNYGNNLLLFECDDILYCYGKCINKEVKFLEMENFQGRNNSLFNINTHSSDFLNSELYLNRNLDIYREIHPMEIPEKGVDLLDNYSNKLDLNLENYFTTVGKLVLFNVVNQGSNFFSPTKYKISFSEINLFRILYDIALYVDNGLEDEEINKKVQNFVKELLGQKDDEYIIEFYLFIIEYERNSSHYLKLVSYMMRNKFLDIEYYRHTIDKGIELKLMKVLDNKNKWSSLTEKKKDNFQVILNDKNSCKVFFKLFTFDLCEEEKYFSELSQGEKNLLLIEGIVLSNYSKNMLILLDEVDLSFHPKWSKKFISNLLKISTPNIHIVITSHSPFILSDLPKENVIFLKDGEQEYPFKDKQTFGANIHTLLSDGFFMSDGLMGEFAKGKIEEIKKFYQIVSKCKKRNKLNVQRKEKLNTYYIDKKEEFEQIHSIIGEPFLKTIIGNYLDDLHLIFSDDKTLIDKRLKELDKEKIYLESLKK